MLNHAIPDVYLWLEGDEKEDHLAYADWKILSVRHFDELMPQMIDVPGRKPAPDAGSVDGEGAE